MSKNKKNPVLPQRISEALNLAGNLCDFLILLDGSGRLLELPNFELLPDIEKQLCQDEINSILSGKICTKIISIAGLKLRFRFSLINTPKGNYIIGGGVKITERNHGLMWDSTYLQYDPWFSPVVEKLTGYSSAELNSLPGKGFNLLAESEVENIKKLISEFIIDRRKKQLTLLYEARTKPGKSLWLQEIVSVDRDQAGNISDYDCSVSELTHFYEEKISLEKLVEELRELNNAKDQFISVLSHDLKSPYTSILGFSEILLNESSLSSEERSEYLSYINTSSQGQLKLINNLLEWSRLVTGRKRIDPVKINLRNMINTIIGNYTRRIHLKNLDVRLINDSYIFAEADEQLLQEVITIFISNAVKYSQPEKNIEIYINRFRGDQVEIIFKDEGIGISQRNKDRMLRLDHVFSSAGTAGERGTGISLILANEIIKKHNGELWFYSEEGKGSEFHFTIPASGSTVLVVDENETEKLKIKNMLSTSFPEFKYDSEPDLVRVVTRMKTENPVMIISAHKLPLMNGLQFVKTLRSEERYAFMPVIIHSDEITDKLREEYRVLGVTHVLDSPVNLKLLKDAIEENLK